MHRIFVGILGVILCTFIGYSYSLRFTKRCKFYDDLLNFINLLKTEVSFSKNTINEIYKNLDNMSDLYAFLIKGEKVRYLTIDEENMLHEFQSLVGSSDSSSQLKMLDYYEEKIRKKLKLEENNKIKFSSSGIKIGFMVGLIVFVMVL